MIVDRIEGSLAVVEVDGGTVDLPAAWLPAGAAEGSVLRVEVEQDSGASRVTITLDSAATEDRIEAMRRLRDSIEEGPSGDLTL
jgi:hypothetical protein